MSEKTVNDSSEFPAGHLISLLGGDVVLLPSTKGKKGPRWEGWQKTTTERMRDEDFVREINSAEGIAVLTGESSAGLCSIDIDYDEMVEPFLALNPTLRETLRSRGRRGCNLWVRIDGAYPRPCVIKQADGSEWGEWRSTGVCTMIHGLHPEGMTYTRSPEVPPVTMRFEDIQWPDNLILPWMNTCDELSGEVTDQFPAEDEEPDERNFYQYEHETGLYSIISPDVIKQVISHRMLLVSRTKPILDGLEKLRSDRNLNAVIAQLRGIAEHRGAFTDRPRAVHLANCMLRFEDGSCIEEGFSPKFRSCNRSPIAFDPAAKCPRFLHELVEPAVHPEDVVLLQKMAGQCLLGTNILQRFLILDGTPGGGKSQYANVIQAVVGLENVTQLRTDHLNERFELFRFQRRTLLVGVDVNKDFLQSKGAPVIKALCGGDWLDAEQKGGTGSFQFQGKFNILMTSNARLQVSLQGDVGAWKRRMLIVRYESLPPKRIIFDFADVLIREEGPGILNWMLEGLQLLLKDIEETGTIRLTDRQKGIVDSLLAESDSLRWFLTNRVRRQDGSDLTVNEIVQAYAGYCPEMGWQPMKDSQIGYQLPSLMLELFQTVKSNSCQREGKAARGFRGVAFINPEDEP